MRLEKRKLSGREKDEESIKLLEKLREQLYSSNISTARRTAFTLSWMQEDGLDILKEALFGGAAKPTKNAASYGLRSTRGRMSKMAIEVLEDGVKHRSRDTSGVCKRALAVIRGEPVPAGRRPDRRPRANRLEIRDIPGRGAQGRRTYRGQGNVRVRPNRSSPQR